MVMARWSVHLTTLFLGKLEQAVNQYFVHILSLVTDRVGVIKIVIVINCNLITFSKVIACNCN